MAIDFGKLEDNNYLIDLLVQMEDVLDTFDTYVFENWFDAQVVDGPIVRRYWLVMTLKRPFRKMPDPRAAKRLVRQGVMIEYDRISGKDANPHRDKINNNDELLKQESENTENDENADDSEGFWLIKVSIPRRLIEEINAEELEAYDDEIDAEDVQDANDQGIDDETEFSNTGEEKDEEDRQQEEEENSETNLSADTDDEEDEEPEPEPAPKGGKTR